MFSLLLLLYVVPVALKHLNLVTVGIGDEEKLRYDRTIDGQRLDLSRLASKRVERLPQRFEIVRAKRHMTVGGAKVVRLASILVLGQLDLKAAFWFAKINKRERREIESMNFL